jgi:hypothetical protein
MLAYKAIIAVDYNRQINTYEIIFCRAFTVHGCSCFAG